MNAAQPDPDTQAAIDSLTRIAQIEPDPVAAVALLGAAFPILARMIYDADDPGLFFQDRVRPALEGLTNLCRDAAHEPARVGAVVPYRVFKRVAARRARGVLLQARRRADREGL